MKDLASVHMKDLALYFKILKFTFNWDPIPAVWVSPSHKTKVSSSQKIGPVIDFINSNN